MRHLASAMAVIVTSVLAVNAQESRPDTALVPAGNFLMGGRQVAPSFYHDHGPYRATDELPRHPVRLTKPFYISKTEVTVAQFRAFIAATSYRTTTEKNGLGIVGFDPHQKENRRTKYTFRRKPEFTWRKPGFGQTDQYPVVGVSWNDAQAYCRWLSQQTGVKYRLPTEAEWEFACRAGGDTFFSWGDNYRGTIHEKANIGNVELENALPERALSQWLFDVKKDPADPFVHTAPVGRFPANAFGLHDMHGNVWEWCEDTYLDTAFQKYKPPKYDHPIPVAVDPFNTESMNQFGDWRAIRGGSWFTSPIQARSAVRGFFEADDAACYIGFRVVREASADEIAVARRDFEREQASHKIVDAATTGGFRSRSGTELRAEFRNPDRNVGRHMPRVPGLTDISINGDGNLDGAVLQDVAAVPRLKSFRLHNPGAGVLDAHFAPFAQRTDLESLQITYTKTITDAALMHFAKHRDLRVLRLDCEQVTDEGLKQLAGLTKLEELRIAGSAARGTVLQTFAKAPLKKLSIRGLTDSSARTLAAFPDLVEIECLDGELSSAGLGHLAGLKNLANLDLTGCQLIDDAGFAALSELRLLQALVLQHTKAGDAAVRSMSKMQQLSRLQLGSPSLTDRGMRGISEILTLRNLRLDAESTNVTDSGFIDFWRLNRLDSLAISCPRVTGAGFATLTELPNLHELRIYSPELTDVGLRFISEIPALRRLRLGGSAGKGPPNVTDDGLLCLSEAAKLTYLELHRRDSAITDEAIARLKQALPQLRIDERR